MSDTFDDLPERIPPHIALTAVSEPVKILRGQFQLIGSSEALLDGELRFRWAPSTTVEFEGSCTPPHIGLGEDWTLASVADPKFTVPAFLTLWNPGSEAAFVRGITTRPFSIGEGPFETLRFCLANFPDYTGETVRYACGEVSFSAPGRLEAATESGRCQLDKVAEAKELTKKARDEGGFVISHAGLWRPSAGFLSARQAESVAEMLFFWFGMLSGSWVGPLFPEGVNAEGRAVWRHFKAWNLSSGLRGSNWLPQRSRLDLSGAFRGFVQLWQEPVWRDALKNSISWYVEANSRESANESRIILAQVALELLSWVVLVEAGHLHSRRHFKRLSAGGRMRALLHHIGVPTTVPSHLSSLESLRDDEAFDGPGAITKVRNALVHYREGKRKIMETVDGEQRLECSQLAMQYLELGLLAVCGYAGYYARRGWRGWRGEDEVPVPWASAD